jgi:hypothetical protein
MRDAFNGPLDRFAGHGAFLHRRDDAAAQFHGVERFTPAIAFADVGHDEFRHFECRKPLPAGQALAATPHLPAFAGQPRVDHFGVDMIAERAMHE